MDRRSQPGRLYASRRCQGYREPVTTDDETPHTAGDGSGPSVKWGIGSSRRARRQIRSTDPRHDCALSRPVRLHHRAVVFAVTIAATGHPPARQCPDLSHAMPCPDQQRLTTTHLDIFTSSFNNLPHVLLIHTLPLHSTRTPTPPTAYPSPAIRHPSFPCIRPSFATQNITCTPGNLRPLLRLSKLPSPAPQSVPPAAPTSTLCY